MMKNYKDDKSGEKLWNAIDKIDDKYIEEAVMYNRKNKTKSRKILIKGVATVAAAAMIMLVSGIFFDSKTSVNDKGDVDGKVSEADSKDKVSDVISKSKLVVSVMASENDKVFLEKGSEIQVTGINYSPAMSSVPAVPFTFDYDADENITIRVSTREDGNLMSYDISEDGIWSVKESGKTLECKPGETLYWEKMSDGFDGNTKGDNYGEITVEVYKGDSCIESRNINIYMNTDNFSMSFE